MVTLRVVFGLVPRTAGHQDQARGRRSSAPCSTCRTSPRPSPPRWRSSSCSTPAPARSTWCSASSGCPQPGWFNDPTWSKPALTLLALWGVGDLMVIFMAALLDVPREQYEAAELDGAGALGRFRFVTLPTSRPILRLRRRSPASSDDAVLHRAAGRRAGRQRADRRVGTADRAGLPGGSTLTLPQLVYNLGFQRFDIGCGLRRRARAVRAVDGVRRAADAPRHRLPGGGLTATTATRPRRAARHARDRPRAGHGRVVARVGGALHAFAVAVGLFFVLPFVFVALTAVMSDQQTLTRDLWPQTFEWHNLVDVWHTPGFATWWRNTIVYAVAGTVLTLVSSFPVAYALARFRFRGRSLAMVRRDRDHDAAAAGRDRADVPGLGPAVPPHRHPVAADHPDGVRRRLLDLPAAAVPAHRSRGVHRGRQGRRLRRPPRDAARRHPDGAAGASRPSRCSSSSTAGTTTSARRSTPARTPAPGP